MDEHITQLYKTPAGSIWNTYNEAIMAHRVERSNIYIESYKLKDLIAIISVCAPEEEEETK